MYGETGSTSVHILRWKLETGNPPEAPKIRHKCRNRNCFKIDHLEIGSPKDNAQDRIRDGTMLIGEKNPNSKISEELAQKIKNSKGNGTAQ